MAQEKHDFATEQKMDHWMAYKAEVIQYAPWDIQEKFSSVASISWDIQEGYLFMRDNLLSNINKFTRKPIIQASSCDWSIKIDCNWLRVPATPTIAMSPEGILV